MKIITKLAMVALVALCLYSCDNFIDVVPQGTATIQKSFVREAQARKFLYSCYSFLPDYTWGGAGQSASILSSHEMFVSPERIITGGHIAHGNQKVVNPYNNFWEGRNGGTDLYRAIRHCNIFLKNIHKVGDMTKARKRKWYAEVKFLKAYYLFYLTRMYGPIVLVKHNIPVSAPKSKTSPVRAPIDSTFNYIESLLNDVIHNPYLPAQISNIQKRYGRVTKTAAYALNAIVKVYEASPLFNGNKLYTGFKNKKGVNPFDTSFDPAKWDSAAAACKKAIDFAVNHGFHLYKLKSSGGLSIKNLSDTTKLQLKLRNEITLATNRVNPGVIWASTSTTTRSIQLYGLPIGINNEHPANLGQRGAANVSLKVASMFYTNHGVPLKQDKTRNYNNRYEVKTVGKDQRFNLKLGYKTAQINMHREPRYYAWLDFDGAIHYGNGIYKGGPSNYHYIRAKQGQINSIRLASGRFNQTGYWPIKVVNYRTEIGSEGTNITINEYNWPIIRLSQLYLLYAEAKNEAEGPGALVYKYLNKVRTHAGIPTVQESWTKYSTNPNQYTTKKGCVRSYTGKN